MALFLENLDCCIQVFFHTGMLSNSQWPKSLDGKAFSEEIICLATYGAYYHWHVSGDRLVVFWMNGSEDSHSCPVDAYLIHVPINLVGLDRLARKLERTVRRGLTLSEAAKGRTFQRTQGV